MLNQSSLNPRRLSRLARDTVRKALDKYEAKRDAWLKASARPRDEQGRFLPKRTDLPHAVDPDALELEYADDPLHPPHLQMDNLPADWDADYQVEPVYEYVVYTPGDPRYTNHADDKVAFVVVNDREEYEALLESSFDDEGWQAPDASQKRAERHPLKLTVRFQREVRKSTPFCDLLDFLTEHPDLGETHVRPLLVETGAYMETWSGRRLSAYELTAPTIKLLWIVALNLIGDKIHKQWTWEKHRAEEAANPKSVEPVKATKRKVEARTKEPEEQKPAEPPSVSPRKVFRELLERCLNAAWRAKHEERLRTEAEERRAEHEAIRLEQDRMLNAWADDVDAVDEPREAFLREWRVCAICRAIELQDNRRNGEHAEPRFVTWMSFADVARARAIGSDDIRRLFAGHPDDAAALAEFEAKWREINSTPVVQTISAAEDPILAMLHNLGARKASSR